MLARKNCIYGRIGFFRYLFYRIIQQLGHLKNLALFFWQIGKSGLYLFKNQ
jgi:hypothetical protein